MRHSLNGDDMGRTTKGETMNRFMVIRTTLVLGALVSAVGCSGSSGDSIPEPVSGTAEGVWQGYSTNGRLVYGAVLADGRYYFLNSYMGDPNKLNGLTQGASGMHAGTFGSVDARDFSPEDASRYWATLNGNYRPGEGLSGTMVVAGGGGASFNLSPMSHATQPTDLALAVGRYPGQASEGSVQRYGWITVDSTGFIAAYGSSSGGYAGGLTDFCSTPNTIDPPETTGQLTPLPIGHVFEVIITSTCFGPPARTYTGIAFYWPEMGWFNIAAVDQDRNTMFIFSGPKG